MALTAYCSTCQRNVYIEEDDTPVCPVCSSPLLEAVPPRETPDPPPPRPRDETT
jgi:DNA-directed RNA polymerase subunit RPC12/RpoP